MHLPIQRSFRLIVFLLVCLFLLDRSLGYIFQRIHERNPPSTLRALYKVLDKDTPYELLILGSSRSLHNVVPGNLTQNAFNLGWDGTAIDMHLALLKVLENKNKLPEIVLLNLDEKMVFNMGMEYVGIEKLSALYNDDDWVRKEINRQSKYNSALYFFQTYKFNGKITSLLNPLKDSLDLSLQGYQPIKPDRKAAEKIKKLIARKKTNLISVGNNPLELNPSFISNFEKVLKIVQEHNIRLVVFSPPIFGPRTFASHKQTLYDFMSERGLPYLDYRNNDRLDFSLLSDTTLWKDLSHLNSRGAEAFTTYLNNDIQSILIKNNSPEALIN